MIENIIVTMADELEEKETYIYLDFGGKIDVASIEKSRPFFRLAGLETANPIVQLNDFLFKGRYVDCVGTNLFFEEEENTDTEFSCFKNETPVSLKLLLTQNKILEMKPVKVQAKRELSSENTNVNVNFDQDYTTTLKKLASRNLNLEDLVVSEPVDIEDKQAERDERVENEKNQAAMEVEVEDKQLETQTDTVYKDSAILEKQLEQLDVPKQSENPVLLEKYQKLQILARRPVHRESELECVEKCENKYKNHFDYHNIERQILQRSDSFPIIDFEIDESTLSNAVDIDRCVLHSVIGISRKRQKVLTQKEKEKLLRIENFEFLSLPARLSILRQELHHLKKYVNSASKLELKIVDEYERTPLDTLNILKKLVFNLESYLQAIKVSLESESKNSSSENDNGKSEEPEDLASGSDNLNSESLQT